MIRDVTIDREAFRAITEAQGYAVSSSGRVASSKGRGKLEGDDGRLWIILRQSLSTKGYPQVNLMIDARSATRSVHRLVLHAWTGPPPPGKPECRHLDGEKTNNYADNLAWGTSAENSADQARHGTTVKGGRNGSAKLSDDDIRTIRRMVSLGLSQEAIARKFGVTRTAVGRVITGHNWGWLQ